MPPASGRKDRAKQVNSYDDIPVARQVATFRGIGCDITERIVLKGCGTERTVPTFMEQKR
jgi:hypothetical protein